MWSANSDISTSSGIFIDIYSFANLWRYLSFLISWINHILKKNISAGIHHILKQLWVIIQNLCSVLLKLFFAACGLCSKYASVQRQFYTFPLSAAWALSNGSLPVSPSNESQITERSLSSHGTLESTSWSNQNFAYELLCESLNVCFPPTPQPLDPTIPHPPVSVVMQWP